MMDSNIKQTIPLAIKKSFLKFDPRRMVSNPTMFVVEIALLLTVVYFLANLTQDKNLIYNLSIIFWIFATICFGNFAESISEETGRSHIVDLQKTHQNLMARLVDGNKDKMVSASSLKNGDIVICEAGDIVPADGEIISGIATIDESAITGESAPVVRESGGNRNIAISGSKIISDSIKIMVIREKGETFINQVSTMVEHTKRHKSPNEIALTVFLVAMSLVYIVVIVSLKLYGEFISGISGQNLSNILTSPTYLAFLVCLLPTTIAGLLSSIGISAIGRLLKKNIVVLNVKALEVAGDIDVLLIDKTGTLTLGNRQAYRFHPKNGYDPQRFARIAQLASLGDETTEGRSISALTKSTYGISKEVIEEKSVRQYAFSSTTKISGIDYNSEGKKVSLRKGAMDAVAKYLEGNGSAIDSEIVKEAERISHKGDTPLILTEDNQAIGIIQLKDIVKGAIKRRFGDLKRMGIKTVMITGDNSLTAAAIAAETGIDDFLANATPQKKLDFIKQYQEEGYIVAMVGDGTNDAPALAQADIGLCMRSGTQTALEAGNMVDLDNNPTKLISIVEIGRQILITRGSLTTFSLASDVAKYFAIIPVLYSSLYETQISKGPLNFMNILNLHSPQTAILSTLIINALLMFMLIPMATTGISKKMLGKNRLLLRNMLVYGIGGIFIPLFCIKLMDLLLSAL